MDDKENSFKRSSRVDEQAEQLFRRRRRKRFLVIVVSIIVLVTISIGAVIDVLVPMNTHESKQVNASTSSDQSIRAMCNVTMYPDSCYSSMSSSLKASASNDSNSNPSPGELFLLSLQVDFNELGKVSSLPQRIIFSGSYSNETSDPLVQSALRDCETLFLDAIDQINQTISSIQADQGDKTMLTSSMIKDIRTWLSTVLTDLETCMDGLEEIGKQLMVTNEVRYAIMNTREFTSNGLAIVSKILTVFSDLNIPIHRKLLTLDHGHHHHHKLDDAGFPMWFHNCDRRLLQEENPEPNITVAKDGTGDFKTINEAVKSIPKTSKSRFFIYIKEGIYVENVIVEKDLWNVMTYGDGMNKTIVSGSLNKVDNTSTFSSGTFIAVGRGFIAKDMGFRNTAGPQKHQAVALRSSSDRSVFYRCSFDAYQDTLYAHSNNQFYRDCHITGTVDFIFGNAAVVLQNCTIQPRQPMENQFNTITAQGKTDSNMNTGISIQRCRITPLDNLTATTYLGRPWKKYSTTVIMKSFMEGFLDPLGWTPMDVEKDPIPSSTFYAEYENVGPGSATEGRVRWPGVLPNITEKVAIKYTVETFIQGSEWLPEARVEYDAGL